MVDFSVNVHLFDLAVIPLHSYAPVLYRNCQPSGSKPPVGAHLVSKVRRPRHMAEEPDLDDTRQHLDLRHDLRTYAVSSSKLGMQEDDVASRAPTVYGSIILSLPNGASMMKFPLSETTGPAATTGWGSCGRTFCCLFVLSLGLQGIMEKRLDTRFTTTGMFPSPQFLCHRIC